MLGAGIKGVYQHDLAFFLGGGSIISLWTPLCSYYIFYLPTPQLFCLTSDFFKIYFITLTAYIIYLLYLLLWMFYLPVHRLYVWCPWRPNEVIQALGTGVTGDR